MGALTQFLEQHPIFMTDQPPRRIGSFRGDDVLEWELRSSTGVLLKVINFGAIIRDWQVPIGGAEMRSVVLGFDRFEDYVEHSPFFGAIVGRVANRIGGARFSVDGKEYKLEENEGPNQLHGGTWTTWARRIWKMESIVGSPHPTLRLVLNSPDGDGGYPGNVRASVTYSLIGNKLRIDFEAISDKPCPLNLVQHNYFNLAGNGDIRDHSLKLAADQFTPFGNGQIPKGEFESVEGTELDFRQERTLRDQKGEPIELDHNFVVAKGVRREKEPVAVLGAPDKSLTLSLWTNQPGLQVYTSKWLSLPVPGLHGKSYPKFGAICLEDQHFPDSVNQPNFPECILRPGQTYRHWCEIEIAK